MSKPMTERDYVIAKGQIALWLGARAMDLTEPKDTPEYMRNLMRAVKEFREAR